MPKLRHTFIVTTGRTGSTLLLGMLNAHDDVHIHGENFGFLYYQYKSLEALNLSLAHLGEETATRSPFQSIDAIDAAAIEQSVHAICREFVDGHVPASAVLSGFKEVRYDMPDLDDFLKFLSQVFPGCMYIFLVRNSADIVTSGFWKSLPASAAMAKVDAMQNRFRSYAERHSSNSALIDYNDLVQPGASLRAIFAMLGIAFDQTRIASALETPHSYGPASVQFHDKTRLQLASRQTLRESLRDFQFDQLATDEEGSRIAMRGVLLPHLNGPSITNVFAVPSGPASAQATGRVEGKFGSASPGLARKYPDDPRSAHARFSVQVPCEMGSADIYFSQGDARVKLGELTIHAESSRSFFEPDRGHTGDQEKSDKPLS